MTTRTHFRACNLCEAMCGLRIDADRDHVTSIRGDEEDSFSRGYLCPKAFALKGVTATAGAKAAIEAAGGSLAE